MVEDSTSPRNCRGEWTAFLPSASEEDGIPRPTSGKSVDRINGVKSCVWMSSANRNFGRWAEHYSHIFVLNRRTVYRFALSRRIPVNGRNPNDGIIPFSVAVALSWSFCFLFALRCWQILFMIHSELFHITWSDWLTAVGVAVELVEHQHRN